MQKKNVRNVLQNSTAAVDVQQTLTISMEIFWMPMILAANYRENA